MPQLPPSSLSELPACPVRTILRGRYIHCGHTAMNTEYARYPGAQAGIVSAKTCATCKIVGWPCEMPKPPPALFVVGRVMLGINLWRWGRALKRLIRFTTFGLAKAKPGCGCKTREACLDQLGARVALYWRRVKQFLLP